MKQLIKPTFIFLAFLVLAGCSTTKRLKPSEYLYTGADVIINPDSSKKIDNEKEIKTSLENKTRPRPNTSLLGIKWKLLIH